MDCIETAQIKTDTDNELHRLQPGQGTIMIAAAITESVALIIESKCRSGHRFQPDFLIRIRYWYAVDAIHLRLPWPEHQWLPRCDYIGQHNAKPFLMKTLHQPSKVELFP